VIVMPSAFDRRFEGNIGWAWVEPGAKVAVYQFIIYFNPEDANWKVPPEFYVDEVVFRGDEWVVEKHDGTVSRSWQSKPDVWPS
jgi:hypothetical protein